MPPWEVVTQCPGLPEFNLPSKLMNYMAYGVPVVAAVEPGFEGGPDHRVLGRLGGLSLLCVCLGRGAPFEERLYRAGQRATVVLLDDHACGEPDQRSVVGEDADDVGAPTHLAVEALERIGRAGGQRAR